MNVAVVTTDEIAWQGTATSVVVPSADGDVGILRGRQPLLAVLRPGVVRITPESGEPVLIEVEAGFVSVDEDNVQVVVDNTGTGRGF